MSVEKAIKILLVEDEPAHVILVKRALSKSATAHFSFETEVVDHLSKAIELMHNDIFDVVLLDLGLPDSQGLETVLNVHEANPDIPIVVLTGLSDEEVGVQAMQKGAQDYLIKEQYTPGILARAIRYAIERQKEINRRKRVEESLQKAHDELKKRKEMLEAQSELRAILTDAIPILLREASPEKENMFIHQMCDSVEDTLWQKHFAGVKDFDMRTLGAVLCKIMYELGGDFEIESVDDSECIVKGSVCPWGTQAQNKQALCMLTRGIFSRLAAKVFRNVTVSLDKTIADKDDYCIVRIDVY